VSFSATGRLLFTLCSDAAAAAAAPVGWAAEKAVLVIGRDATDILDRTPRRIWPPGVSA
jgi:hypothetical protein